MADVLAPEELPTFCDEEQGRGITTKPLYGIRFFRK